MWFTLERGYRACACLDTSAALRAADKHTPCTELDRNTEKRNRSERGIAANLLGDCRAHTETGIFRFIAVFAHS